MKKHLVSAALIISCFSWMSCANESEAKDQNASANASTPANTPANTNAAPAENVAEVALTTIEVENPVFDFGKIKEGGKVQHTFKIKNTGDKPYLIAKAEPSCGCTVPSFSKKPVMPGEFATIDIEFDTNGRKGSNTKTINVTSNVKDPIVLTFKAEVE